MQRPPSWPQQPVSVNVGKWYQWALAVIIVIVLLAQLPRGSIRSSTSWQIPPGVDVYVQSHGVHMPTKSCVCKLSMCKCMHMPNFEIVATSEHHSHVQCRKMRLHHSQIHFLTKVIEYSACEGGLLFILL